MLVTSESVFFSSTFTATAIGTTESIADDAIADDVELAAHKIP
jgi:hypothetical protein